MGHESGGMDQTMEEENMKLSERARKILETLRVSTVEEQKDGLPAGLAEREEALADLIKGGYNVCTLLGHPTVYPHGKAIPPGKCCEKPAGEAARAVSPLKDLRVNDKGIIAYLATNDPARLNKLMAMGALPGLPIILIQKYPSYVFQVGQSQFAIDQEMAEGIYVRRRKDDDRD